MKEMVPTKLQQIINFLRTHYPNSEPPLDALIELEAATKENLQTDEGKIKEDQS